LIEDLAIKLKVTDAEVRDQINSDRKALELAPLPPAAEKKGTFDFILKRKYLTAQDPVSHVP
jgi:hypothetical protein